MLQSTFFINIIIYFLILFSIYIIFQKSIVNNIKSIIRYMYRRRKKTAIYDYFRKIFLSIYDIQDEKELETKVYTFYFKTVFIFLTFFIVTFRYNIILYKLYFAIVKSLIPSTIVSLVPFFLLIIKLFNTQRDSSKEAPLVVSEILNQYRIYNNNIIEALDATVLNLSNKILCRRYLLRLSMRLKEYKTDNELIQILDEFVFTVNTNWIKMLSDSIFFALTNNVDISLGLDGLLEQIKSIDETQNIGNRLNNEGFAMGKHLAPILYIVLAVISVQMIGSTLTEFLYYQFTGVGIKYFIAIVALFVTCYVCEYFYKRRKFDF